MGITTVGQSASWSNGIEEVLLSSPSSRTGASPQDTVCCLVIPGRPLFKSRVLPLCRRYSQCVYKPH